MLSGLCAFVCLSALSHFSPCACLCGPAVQGSCQASLPASLIPLVTRCAPWPPASPFSTVPLVTSSGQSTPVQQSTARPASGRTGAHSSPQCEPPSPSSLCHAFLLFRPLPSSPPCSSSLLVNTTFLRSFSLVMVPGSPFHTCTLLLLSLLSPATRCFLPPLPMPFRAVYVRACLNRRCVCVCLFVCVSLCVSLCVCLFSCV